MQRSQVINPFTTRLSLLSIIYEDELGSYRRGIFIINDLWEETVTRSKNHGTIGNVHSDAFLMYWNILGKEIAIDSRQIYFTNRIV